MNQSRAEKRLMSRITIVMAAALICAVVPARAQISAVEKDWQICQSDASGDAALAACSRVIGNKTTSKARLAEAFNSRGVVYDRTKEFDLAIADYNEALRLKPKSAVAFNNRGAAYRKNGEFDRAISDFNEAIRLKPNLANAFNNRGLAHAGNGDYQRAIADYDNALRLKSNYATPFNNRALAHAEQGNHEKAIADYNAALRLKPDYAEAFNNRGYSFLAKGDLDRAIIDLDAAIRLKPDYPNPYRHRGRAFVAKGDYRRALADFDHALRLDPNYAEAKADRDHAERQLAAMTKPASTPAQQTAAATPTALATNPPLTHAAPSATQHRVALVIANAKYQHADPLRNPPNDSRRVADALRAVGFTSVTVKSDLSKQGLIDALREFSRLASDADWALVYYAGHGVAVDGTNYLVPVEAKLEDVIEVGNEALDQQHVLNRIGGAKKLRLVVLDACRDNPFRRRLAMSQTGGQATRDIRERGLARSEPKQLGELIIYAARDGTKAQDGEGDMSPFAEAFATHLKEPGVDIRRLIDKVRDSVLKATGNNQMPFSYGSLPDEDFVFAAK